MEHTFEWIIILLQLVIIVMICTKTHYWGKLRRKSSKEEVKKHVMRYLHAHGYRYGLGKREDELYFFKNDLQYLINFSYRGEHTLLFFYLGIEEKELDSQQMVLLGLAINNKYNLMKFCVYDDSYSLDLGMEIEDCQTFDNRFPNAMNFYNRVLEDIGEIKKDLLKEEEEKPSEEQAKRKIGF